ncbi:hypothetical protein Dda_5256 [Drechslerella dactyloides]|uniref:DUF7587 domain-containing protein n=1 Tax=Drechslerella dactyloides TaxID=74499 RepID=A0AAD6IVX3_DREDA|nr:hypothetical protein Dda_5256 [Drechslerella dactyloides]
MVAAGNLHCYSDTLAALRKAAVSLNIDLKLKTTIQIPTIQASPSSSSRKRRYRHEISDDDSWVPSNRYEHDEDGGDFELRRRNSRPSSKLLFRVYSKYSHGISSNQGHWAGAFANSRLIPPLNEAELPGLDESLASHLKSEEVPGGSPFISTTDSFLWVLTKSAKMKGRTRISVIDRTKVQYPITHMAGAYRRLKDAGLLEGIERYYGNFEFLVYGGVSEDAIIHDFSVHEFKNFVDDGFYRMQVVCPEIVFNRRGSTPKKKRKDIADINLSRNRSLVAIDQLSAFVLANVADKSLQDDFKQNLKLNWELEKRCSGDV